MRYRTILIACLSGLMTLTWWGCGEEKKATAVAESEGEADEEKAEAPAEAPAEEAKPVYTPPDALPPAAVDAQYGKGKHKRAKKLNTAAIRARRKGDTAKAMKKYKKALEASPGHAMARFNLACEYARFGKADEAILELEHLFRMGTPEALKRIAKLKSDKDFDPIRDDPRIKAISKLFTIYTVDWEVKVKDPKCDEACKMKMKVLVDKDGEALKPIKIKPAEGAEQLSFNIDMDHYGHCVGKDEDKGVLCANINFDCGDDCYQDRIFVRVAGSGDDRKLQVVRYEYCMGGIECPDESTTLHERPLKKYEQVFAKKHDLDPKVAATALSFGPADLKKLYHRDSSLSIAGKTLYGWAEAKAMLDSMFGRDTYEGDWEEDFEEGFDGWHFDAPSTWSCRKLCCKIPKDSIGMDVCMGSESPPYVEQVCFAKVAGRLALKKLQFGDCNHGGGP